MSASPLRSWTKAGVLCALLVTLFRVGYSEEPKAPTDAERLTRATALLQQQNPAQQQRGLAILGRLKTPAAEKILTEQWEKLERGELPLPLWLDVIEAAEAQGQPGLQQKLAAYRKRAAAASDPLQSFRECLEGGDAASGREIFFETHQSMCERCHSVNGQGGTIGPDLTGLGLRSDRIHVLESIVQPNASVVLGYGCYTFTFQSGETFTGLLNSETRDHVIVISIEDGSRRSLRTEDLAQRTPLPSAMPPIFGQALTRRQIRDLVEFIATSAPE